MKLSTLIPAVNVLAITLPAAFLLFSAFNKPDANSQFDPNLSNELKSLRSELNNLKMVSDELTAIKQRLAEIENKRTHQSSTEIKPSEQIDTQQSVNKPTADSKKMEQQREEQNAKSLELMHQVFLTEASDAQWSSETTNKISGFFDTEEGAKLNVSDIQCRKTLCKIELSKVDRMNGTGSLSLQFAMHVGGVLPQTRYFYEENEDGTSNVTIFLARKGYELPNEDDSHV